MASVQLIITRVQTEIGNATGEPDSDWTDADYILAKLATLSDDIANRLELLDLNYATVEVILPAVPANTVDLSAFQASGQPLAMMILPKSIEWRLVGESEEDWSFAPQVDKVIVNLVRHPFEGEVDQRGYVGCHRCSLRVDVGRDRACSPGRRRFTQRELEAANLQGFVEDL